MFDLRKIPMLRVLVPFFGGIFTGLHVNSEYQDFRVLLLLLILWITIVVIFKWQRRKPALFPWFISLLLCLFFYLAGAGSGIQSRPHDPGLPVDQWVQVQGKLNETPHPGRFAYEFEMKVQLVCSLDSIYRIGTQLQCYIPVPADSLMPVQGETWQFTGTLAGIQNSGNPGMPNYRAILGRKDCWYRFYISSDTLAARFNKKVAGKERKLAPAQLRRALSEHWHGDREEIALLKAVCLGDRSSLSDDLRQAYTAAGGMHLLAVSGLHVGLIWWVLHYMTGWMSLIFRKEIQRTLLVVGLLWFYAYITGFSSSVCRSVTMFSFLSVGRLMGKRVQTLNVILASAFLLVLINPLRLKDVGFQLSYAAITGIVALHPLTLRLLRVKNRVLRWFWEASSVSFAAQLVTAPIVIYYFHQLPLYSLVTSLVAVPVLSFLIAVFVCSVPFVSAGFLQSVFSFLLIWPARLMNRSVEYLGAMPGAVLDDLELDLVGLLIWIFVLLLFMIALHGRRRLPCYLMFLLISFSLIWSSYSRVIRCKSSELVIGHFRGASQVSIRIGAKVDHYYWYRDSTSMSYLETYRDLAWNSRVYKNRVYGGELRAERETLVWNSAQASSCIRLGEGIWLMGGDDICGLVITAHGSEQVLDILIGDRTKQQTLRPDFILLSGEPLLDVLQFEEKLEETAVVIDGSNRSWYKELMLAQSDRIYLTDQAGAYVKRW